MQTDSVVCRLRPDDGLIKKGRNMSSNNKTIPYLVVFDLLLFITDIRYTKGVVHLKMFFTHCLISLFSLSELTEAWFI